jgi:hypothetical protein
MQRSQVQSLGLRRQPFGQTKNTRDTNFRFVRCKKQVKLPGAIYIAIGRSRREAGSLLLFSLPLVSSFVAGVAVLVSDQ